MFSFRKDAISIQEVADEHFIHSNDLSLPANQINSFLVTYEWLQTILATQYLV
jgi:hypothetical protein